MTVADPSGWGAAEWLAVASIATMLIGAIVGAIVQLARLRRENTEQHAEGRAITTDIRDRLLDIHDSIDRVDGKVDRVADRVDRHLADHANKRRRWQR